MRKILILVLIGLILIMSSFIWELFAVPNILRSFSAEKNGNLAGENTTFMEGCLGTIKIFEKDNISFLNISIDDFKMHWRNITVTSTGVYDKNTGENISGSDDEKRENMEKRMFFPLFGVEKRNYNIWDDFIKNNTTAEFICESTIKGKRVYVYHVNIDSYLLKEKIFGRRSDTSLKKITEKEILKVLLHESTFYYIEPETSIPLNIKMCVNISIIMPDMTILNVDEGDKITYSEGEVWIRNESYPFIYEKKDVIVEKHLLSKISEENPRIAIFESWTIYYDKNTGEKIGDKYKEEHEIFAVDRMTYMYVPYKNSRRQGYYTFPVGNVEQKSYPMWDEIAETQNYANFIREDVFSGRDIYVYKMITDNVTVETPVFVPVYRHPGTEYKYSGTTTFFVDKKSGIPIYLEVNGSIYLSSKGPLSLIEYPLTTFNFSSDNMTVKNMTKMASFFSEVILPLSSKELPAFSLRIQYTDEFIDKMIVLADRVAKLLSILKIWVPTSTFIPGVIIVIIGIHSYRKKKIRNRRLETLVIDFNEKYDTKEMR